jgi:SAM-dependent methyltransferase
MGLDRTAAHVLSGAKALGADFGRSVMLGRQWLTAPAETLDQIAAIHGGAGARIADSDYAEPLFRLLGADTVDSVDVSEFEGASLIHDMNEPLPTELHGRFSLVFDGGTLEHVFNAPLAFKSAMQMLSPGGFFVGVSPGNNFMGHGFWQFSPELLYRLFSPANGFRTLAVLVQELPHRWREVRHGRYYLARDPAELGWRVELRNMWPTNVAVIARKETDIEPFREWPQQSDYVRLWNAADPAGRSTSASLKSMVRKLVPPGLERTLRPPLRNKAYVPVSTDDLMRGRLPASAGSSA